MAGDTATAGCQVRNVAGAPKAQNAVLSISEPGAGPYTSSD